MAFHIPYAWCAVIMAVITAVYVILGGYMATAINDFIQGIIMLIGIVAVIGAVLSGQGGFMEAVGKMAEIPSDVPGHYGQSGSVYLIFWSGSSESSRGGDPYFPGDLGTPTDDP